MRIYKNTSFRLTIFSKRFIIQENHSERMEKMHKESIMKKSTIKLQVATAFTASMLVLSALFSCANDSESLKDIPEELTESNAKEVLGEDYKKRDTIKIPKGVVRIEKDAFRECAAQSIIIPSTVTRIGDNDNWYWGVFYGCENLQSIEIPESVTYIGSNAFYGCKSLKTVTLNEGLTIIKGSAFKNCTSLKEITIPQSVTSIGGSAFRECAALKKVVLTENISVIEDSTFDDCTALTNITIPEGVTCIGNYAFDECTSLTAITLPESLSEFKDWAFNKCSSLRRVTFLAKNPPKAGYNPFDGCDSNITFYVPKDSVEAYKTQWSRYEDSIEAIR